LRQCGEEQGNVEDEPQHAIGADVAVFHHAECLLRVVPPRSETIEKVGQAVFVQRAREQHPHDEG